MATNDPTNSVDRDEALVIALLALRPETWIHRRVEEVSYVNEYTVRRRISVDLSVPEEVARRRSPRGVVHLPIAQLQKAPLTRFDLRDENGRSIPMMTTDQNGRLSVAVLRVLADVTAGNLVDPIVEKYIPWLVFTTDDRDRDIAMEKIFPPGLEVGRVLRASAFRALALDLSRNFLLYLPVSRAEIGRRRIVKLAYDAGTEAPAPTRITERLGLRAVSTNFNVPLAGYGSSYHFEMVAPEEMLITSGSFVGRRGGQVVNHRVERPTARAHFYLGGLDRALGVVNVSVRGASDLLAGAAFFAMLSAATLIFVRVRIDEFARQTSFDAVVAALLAAPALIVAYITRPTEHPVVTTFLIGVRRLAVASVVLSFVGALVLFAGYENEQLRRVFAVLSVGSLACALGLVSSWLAQRTKG